VNDNYKKGLAFEQDFARRLGAKLQPGSGNQWHAKLDVKGRSFLWSLKSTVKGSFRLTTDMLAETIHAVDGPGGKGGNTLPGMAIRIADEDFVVLRASDFIQIVQDEVKIAPADKRTAKIEAGKVSTFDRKLGAQDGSQEEY
jgi:hypothetical protein